MTQGLVQELDFTCAESNANEREDETMFFSICIIFAQCEIQHLNQLPYSSEQLKKKKTCQISIFFVAIALNALSMHYLNLGLYSVV